MSFGSLFSCLYVYFHVIRVYNINMKIYESLYDWQKKIVDSIYDKDSYGLFLKMGLGKTPVSLACCERHFCTKLMIVSINAKASETESVPGSFLNWAKKSEVFSSYDILTKKSKPEDFRVDRKQIFIINYESLFERGSKNEKRTQKVTLKDIVKAYISSCMGHVCGFVIDESHKLKNYSSLQTSACLKIQAMTRFNSKMLYTYLLTGTPFTTGFIDLWTQLKMLGSSMTKTTFIDNFCIRDNKPGLLGWQQPIIAYKNTDLLFRILHRYAITIDTEQVIDLPDQIFIDHKMPMTNAFKIFTNEKATGKDILKFILDNDKIDNIEGVNVDEYMKDPEKKYLNQFYRCMTYPDLSGMAEETGVFWMRSRQLSIGFQGNADSSRWYDRQRLDALKSFLEENEDNYVIFYSYTPEMTEIYKICKDLGYNIDIWSGEIKSLKNYEAYDAMPEGKRLINSKNVIIANFASGATGTNWQDYHNMILFDIPIYRDYAQGIERIHRIGQKHTCVYHVFYQNNWLDLGMKKSLDEKKDYTVETFESDAERVKETLEANDCQHESKFKFKSINI